MNDLGLHHNIQHASSFTRHESHHSLPHWPPHHFRMRRESKRTSHHPQPAQSGQPIPRHTSNQLPDEKGKPDAQDLDKKEYYNPTLWWFTSTAFPLIAGTFGPISNLFSICGLVQSWRISEPDGSRVGDPGWLLALNIVSLVFALLANILLLFNFAKRIPYRIAQPFTIIFWYLSSLFLLIPICIAHTTLLHESSSYSLTESYYYALIACVLYFIVSTLLLLNVLGAHYPFYAYPPSFSRLSTPQRTLMLQTILFSAYLALGGGIFAAFEGWAFVDGVYWADYTLLTIGLGSDFPLTTTKGRMVLIPYAALGIVFVGLIVSSVRGLVLERGKARIARRRLQKERERWEGIIDHAAEVGGDEGGDRRHAQGKRRAESRDVKRFSIARQKVLSKELPLKERADDKEANNHKVWQRREYELMRYIEKSANRMEGFIALGFSVFVFILVWVGGALVFWACEKNDANWTYPNALYFTYVAILTIGYGDLYPTTAAARPFFVIWSLVAVPAVTVLISNMGETVVHWVQEGTTWLGRRSLLPEKTGDGKKDQESVGKAEGDAEKGEGSRIPAWMRRERKKSTAPSSQQSVYRLEKTEELSQIGTSPTQIGTRAEAEGTQTLEIEQEDVGTQTVEQTPDEQREEEEELVLSIRLSREISRVAKDATQVPPMQYAWHEWVRWLKVMDEAGETLGVVTHTTSPREPPMGRLVKFGRQQDLERSRTQQNGEGPSAIGGYPEDNTEVGMDAAAAAEVWKWTWLDDEGPLFSQETETQWVLNKLCMLLEKVAEKEAEAIAATRGQS